ncbi:Zn(II)2Cys6 transcription factor [Aspergillus saccharolyticus JOP 1030-1]|uniref:Zn(2)-C6 fungal-type domain-containing protein n=1 Tax=Aspergillus saccharolyticus JOP 1030-1 TaxID=1450539 RepID=A0A318Z0H9_9EURO|nr:hypothetical protein BP01DRAFT_192976 [Aspergillus saccharolyticus JOP 1030-1]PYH40801.1 hypothetical protein BP01DRAFT_192976 [Aspergillus saccharolyticus JOP 1030-1]
MDGDSPLTIAYGHACGTCARAKVRCIPRTRDSPCERCERLGKECRPGLRRRRPKRLSKAAQLEQKMDGLMSLLQSTGQLPGGRQLPVSAGSQECAATLGNPLCTPESDGSLSPRQSPPTTIIAPSPAEAEAMLQSFRTHKLACLPFVHIPSSSTPAELQRDSPFLWRCLITTETKDAAQQALRCVDIRQTAAQIAMVDCDKSLDLLQGLLMHIAWISFQSSPPKLLMIMYCQIATALVCELGLNRPSRTEAAMLPPVCNDLLPHAPPPQFPASRPRTLDERRAVLGCFVISSVIAQFLGRMEVMRWTPHMTESVEILSNSNESPHDSTLAYLARSRLLVEHIREGPWNGENSSSSGIPRAPVPFYMSSLQTQLNQLRADIPSILLNSSNPLIFYLFQAETTLYETALIRPFTDGNDLPGALDSCRLDHLCACLTAVRAFFDSVLTTPIPTYASFPIIQSILIAHCLVTLSRLTFADIPGWDTRLVRRTADVIEISDQISDMLEQATALNREGQDKDPFSRLALTVRRLRATWAARLGEQAPTGPAADGGVVDPPPQISSQQDLVYPEQPQLPGQVPISAVDLWDFDVFFAGSDGAWLMDAVTTGGSG